MKELVLAVFCLPFVLAAGELIVAPDGLSPAGALKKIREKKAKGDKSAWTVRVKPGHYTLTGPLLFTPADSGSPKAPVSWIGEGSPVFAGGSVLTNWKDLGNGVWSAPVPRDGNGKAIYFEQLWVNGRRATRSRLPKCGYFIPTGGAETAIKDASGKHTIGWNETVTFTNAAVAALARVPADELASAQLLVRHKWSFARRIIRGFDAATGTVRTSAPCEWPNWGRWGKESLCVFENLRSAFDTPGEWFYDTKTGEVLYRPLPGEALAAVKAVVPSSKISRLAEFKGDCDTGAYVHDISFKGITFAYSDAWTGSGNKGPTESLQHQAASQSDGAITAEGAHRITWDSCVFAHTGNYALRFNNGCVSNRILNCLLEDFGAGGVWMGSDRGYTAKGEALTRRVITKTAPRSTAFNTIDNCIIRHGGLFNPEGTGIALTHVSDSKVMHCEIYDLFYTGVSVGWTWGYAGSVAQRNEIGFNLIHDLGKAQMADMGGVYTLGTSFGTRVHDNVIYNVASYSYGGWGLYTDEGSEGIVMENNLVYNTHDGGFHQHYGVANIIRNNIFCFNRTTGSIRTQRQLVQNIPSSVHILNNIVMTKEGPLVSSGAPGVNGIWAANLWFVPGGAPAVFGQKPDWNGWKTSGREIGGLFADPLFEDAEKLDFRLKPDSPAFALGFKAFDFTRAGRRK